MLENLNPVQAQAVQAIEGPVLVLAGPGSGKTRVLTQRIAYLMRVCGVRPHNILAVTFTNKAAREMAARVNQLVGEQAALTIGTFHAICARFLRREGHVLGLGNNFVIYDEDDSQRLITQVLKELNLDSTLYRPSAVQSAISRAKNELITVEKYRPPSYWHEGVARAYERYEQLKRENNALDFDDLLLKAEELFRTQDEVRLRYQRRYTFILVDEFQDTNKAQYELVVHLAGERRNVFVVGDEDQSIYSWRGADFRNVLRFRKDFPDAKLFLLEQNYRSTQTILGAAQAIISRNTQRAKKTLWTQNERGPAIRLIEAYDEREEAEYVANQIRELNAREGLPYGECAVMYRTNAQSRAIEDALLQHGIPYRLVGSTRFYQRREVKDVLSYLRLIHNPDDEVSLLRVINVPPRAIGEKTIGELASWAQGLGMSSGAALLHLMRLWEKQGDLKGTPFSGRAARQLLRFAELLSDLVAAREEGSLSDLLERVLDKTAYLNYLRDGTEEGESRAENVRELFSVTDRYSAMPMDAALPAFLEEVALVADMDEVDWQSDAVTLLTLHMAKGLEYGAVFIVGMEEGICPHSRSMDSLDAMEEERRLCYVGVTRAKRHLYLLRAFRRTLYGSSEVRDPSRFLFDIPREYLDGGSLHGALGRKPLASTATAPAPRTQAERRQNISERRARVERFAARSQRERPASTADRPMPVPRYEPQSEPPPPRPSTGALMPTYHAGDTVMHPVFGQGMVISSRILDDDEEVTVSFEGRGVKRLLASIARMTKVE